jgi:hypothetical protein
MKIELESKSSNCADRLRCVVCEQTFNSDRLRSLLCHDDGLIFGDVCPHCRQQGGDYIRQKLGDRAAKVFERIHAQLSQQPRSIDTSTILLEREALELSEMAEQPLKIPPIYVWWWKRFEMLITESQELELARRGNPHPRPKLTITFLEEEPH